MVSEKVLYLNFNEGAISAVFGLHPLLPQTLRHTNYPELIEYDRVNGTLESNHLLRECFCHKNEKPRQNEDNKKLKR